MESAITMVLDPAITMAVQVITMPWNERSRWSGPADHDAVESVATITWRAHSDPTRLVFAAPSEAAGQERVFVKTAAGNVGGARATGVASVEVALAADAVSGSARVAVGLADPPEDGAADAFATFQITIQPASGVDAATPEAP